MEIPNTQMKLISLSAGKLYYVEKMLCIQMGMGKHKHHMNHTTNFCCVCCKQMPTKIENDVAQHVGVAAG